LSGGQKARICLARALYSDADVYLLDDPLSAVDTKVGEQMFSDAIHGFLEGKTVILNTHQLHFALECDRIFVMEDQKVTVTGTFEEINERRPDIFKEAFSNVDKEELDNYNEFLEFQERL